MIWQCVFKDMYLHPLTRGLNFAVVCRVIFVFWEETAQACCYIIWFSVEVKKIKA